MKKTTTLLTLILLFTFRAFAGPVDPEKALEIANSFWKTLPNLKQTELVVSPSVAPSKSAAIRDGVQKVDEQYYLFSPEDKSGFVIISGDDRLAPVVGYSTSACVGEMPPALIDWLANYSNFVDDVRAGVVEPARTTAVAGTRIEPMLKTSWNQSAPYNNYCPEVSGQKTPTGCTATATAQVMKFHEWPEKPTKDVTWYNNITGKNEPVYITQNTYEWSKMLNHYRNGYTTEQAHAVAQLMVDVGKAINSSYAPGGTGSSDIYAARALVKVFDYSPDIRVYKRNECTYDEFISIIRENLEARQPLVHTGHGQSYAAGHAFVCDGIDENNLVHIDWGWDGAYNGFFDIGSMSPGGTGIGGGQDRYNVGQSIIANIRPRKADEADRKGDPTVYLYEILDEANNNASVEEHTAKFVSGNAKFKTKIQLLNWSHSNVDMYFGVSITSADGTFEKVVKNEQKTILAFENAQAFLWDINVNNTNTSNTNYLKEGTYHVEIVYWVGNEEPVKMKSENNCLILEVGKNSAKLSKALPAVELSAFKFRTAPLTQNDKMVFDVAFRNTNTNNATVVIVPIVNRLNGDAVVKSDTLTSAGVLINVFDNTNFLATYSINNAFNDCGDHYVSFAYDLRNSYTDHNTGVDKKKLKSIAGKSGVFTLEELPDGPIPTLSTVATTATTVGATLTVNATIKNATITNSPYSGTLGLFIEKDGDEILLATGELSGLAQGKTASFKYSATDYVPVIGVGTYEVYVCEQVNGEWARLRQSEKFYFTLKEAEKSVLYAASEIVVGYNNITRPGDDADVRLALGCMCGDFNGYVRVNVANGVTPVLRSEFIPMTMANGEVRDVNLSSACGPKALLKEWTIVIKYYDSNKRELGTVSKNTLNYLGNGNFQVVSATAVDEVQATGTTITAGVGCVTVEGAVSVKVIGFDGRVVYSGNAAIVALEQGLYIVKATDASGNVVAKKVLVK